MKSPPTALQSAIQHMDMEEVGLAGQTCPWSEQLLIAREEHDAEKTTTDPLGPLCWRAVRILSMYLPNSRAPTELYASNGRVNILWYDDADLGLVAYVYQAESSPPTVQIKHFAKDVMSTIVLRDAADCIYKTLASVISPSTTVVVPPSIPSLPTTWADMIHRAKVNASEEEDDIPVPPSSWD